MICIKTIKQRKAVYGSNFEEIARLQSEYLKVTITAKDVAKMMAIMKQTRIDFIVSRLLVLKNDVNFDSNDIQAEIKQLREALEDSKKDFENYNWISENFQEYEAL